MFYGETLGHRYIQIDACKHCENKRVPVYFSDILSDCKYNYTIPDGYAVLINTEAGILADVTIYKSDTVSLLSQLITSNQSIPYRFSCMANNLEYDKNNNIIYADIKVVYFSINGLGDIPEFRII